MFSAPSRAPGAPRGPEPGLPERPARPSRPFPRPLREAALPTLPGQGRAGGPGTLRSAERGRRCVWVWGLGRWRECLASHIGATLWGARDPKGGRSTTEVYPWSSSQRVSLTTGDWCAARKGCDPEVLAPAEAGRPALTLSRKYMSFAPPSVHAVKSHKPLYTPPERARGTGRRRRGTLSIQWFLVFF